MSLDIRSIFHGMSDADFNVEAANTLSDILSEIRSKLRGYEDLSSVPILYRHTSNEEDMMRLGCIRLLTDERIVRWNPEQEDDSVDYLVTVVNRYEFEKLWLKSKGRSQEQINKELPNLVYYNPINGEGSVNGNTIRLEPKSSRKARELFDALVAAAPESVPRERLAAILRLGTDMKLSPTDASREISLAFTNLKKRCHVGADVIELSGDGKLNAIVTLLNKTPDFFIFPE